MISRNLFCAGHIMPARPAIVRLARFCAWGNHWMSEADETLGRSGAPVTHGMCPEHAAEFERGIGGPENGSAA